MGAATAAKAPSALRTASPLRRAKGRRTLHPPGETVTYVNGPFCYHLSGPDTSPSLVGGDRRRIEGQAGAFHEGVGQEHHQRPDDVDSGWLRAYLFSRVIMLPVVVIAAPLVRRLTEAITD